MSPFEAIMLVCFGAAWPFAIYKSYKSGSVKGKSFQFLVVVIIGYGAGVLHKIYYVYDRVIYLYILNTLMVLTDACLYIRNLKIESANYKKELETLYNQGLLFTKIGNLQQALASFDGAMKIDPEYCDIQKVREMVYNKLEKTRHSLIDASEAEEAARIRYNESDAFMEVGMESEALAAIDAAIATMPARADFWYKKGVILQKLNKFDEALKSLERSIEINPLNPDAWHHKCACYAGLNMPDEALKCLDRVVAISPDHSPKD